MDELGPVDGLDLVHLQCHFGLDTLAWARRGARVTGLDFSGEAVAAARRVAAEAGLDAEFVEADVHDARGALGGRSFDIAYTGFGALIWLPDLAGWAELVRDLLRPGGRLYLAEFHPITHVFGWQARTIEHGYFDRGPFRWDDEGTYTDTDEGARFEHTASVEWQHTLGDVLSAVLGAGLVVELFHEHDFTCSRAGRTWSRSRAAGSCCRPGRRPCPSSTRCGPGGPDSRRVLGGPAGRHPVVDPGGGPADAPHRGGERQEPADQHQPEVAVHHR